MVMIYVLVFGLLVGSFLSVCIYRIPRGSGYAELHEDNPEFKPLAVNSPKRSFCPHCHTQLQWFENLPVISWVFQLGACRHCGASVSARYPAVELLSTIFALGSFVTFGLTPTGLLVYLFCAALIVISFIDYDYYIIPDCLSLVGTVAGIIVACLNWWLKIFTWPVVADPTESALGILLGAGFLYLVAELYFRLRKIEGLGLGDVKLLAMVGAFFGPLCALYTIFLGAMIGTVCGVLLIVLAGRSTKHYLPFGPYLAVGTVAYIFFQQDLITSTHLLTEAYSNWLLGLLGG